MSALYEKDFYAWCLEQADFIKQGSFNLIDKEKIEQELINMGESEKRELKNRLVLLIFHLLKWKYQEAMRCNSWLRTIKIQRSEVKEHIKSNPSLKPYLKEIVERVYEKSVDKACNESGLAFEAFPTSMPFTIEQALQEEWLP